MMKWQVYVATVHRQWKHTTSIQQKKPPRAKALYIHSPPLLAHCSTVWYTANRGNKGKKTMNLCVMPNHRHEGFSIPGTSWYCPQNVLCRGAASPATHSYVWCIGVSLVDRLSEKLCNFTLSDSCKRIRLVAVTNKAVAVSHYRMPATCLEGPQVPSISGT